MQDQGLVLRQSVRLPQPAGLQTEIIYSNGDAIGALPQPIPAR
jgi:hypothetical protein